MTPQPEAERFYVATLEGDLTPRRGGSGPAGVTADVVDRLNCRRVVHSFRSEDMRGSRTSHDWRRFQVIHLAELEAARLNRLHRHSERQPAERQ